ncbi:MAG: hypothetical protein ACE5IY_11015 [bacterium]
MLKRITQTILLGLVFQTTACSTENAPEEAPAPKTRGTEYLALMPENTHVLFYANLEEMKKTPLGEDFRVEFEEKMKEEEEEDYFEFVEKTGVDLKKDVYELWIGGIAQGGQEVNSGAIINGRFDEKRIVDYLRTKEPHKIDETHYRDHTIYILEEKDKQMTFLTSGMIVIGNRQWIAAIIDQAEDGGKNVLDNPAMQDYIQQVPHKEHFWGVMNLSEMSDAWARELRRKSAFTGTKSIENMKSLVFCTHFDRKTDVFLKGNFTAHEEAKAVAEMVNGFKALAKLMVADDREAVDMISDITIKSEGAIVEITSTLDESFWNKFKEKRKRLSGAPVKLL